MGVLLFLDEGFVSFLEGYTYDESTTAINFTAARFDIIRS